MTHKNPFEIRAEMIKLAKDYMDTQQELNIQFANDMYEQGKKNILEVQEAYKMYSMEDMMIKANKNTRLLIENIEAQNLYTH